MTAPTDTCDHKRVPRVDGVYWSEYKWCTSKLFIGAIYWPPTKEGGNDSTGRRYERRVKQLLQNMDTLSAYGIVIIHGDLNARMGTNFIQNSIDKKTNSHEWHLRAFIPGSTYTFMTDCGSLFPDQTLGKLTGYMDVHDACVGTTGRMRGMTAAQQAS